VAAPSHSFPAARDAGPSAQERAIVTIYALAARISDRHDRVKPAERPVVRSVPEANRPTSARSVAGRGVWPARRSPP
jgi:hypothetical protein